MISKRDSLWARTLRNKYGCGIDVIPKIGQRNCNSNLWLGFCRVWDKVLKSTSWKIGNGNEVSFWNDCWYKQGVYLKDTVNRPLSATELEEKVSEFLLSNGEWNMVKLCRFLLEEMCKDILKRHVSGSDGMDDTIVWNHSKEVEFLVKSAYREIYKNEHMKMEKHWDMNWKWQGT